MQRALFLVATVTACTTVDTVTLDPFVDESKEDGAPARLERLDRSRLAIDEASDLVNVDGKLYGVSDRHAKIFAIDDQFQVTDLMDVKANDLEAIGYDPMRREFLIADEASAKVWRVDSNGDRYDAIELEKAKDGNSGIEGIVVANDRLYAVKEKLPARIYELDAAGNVLFSEKVDFAKDLSAITYNPDDKHIYVLSDEDEALYRLDRNFKPDRAWRIPVPNPEGLAFDDHRLYIVGDGEGRIHTFQFVD